MEGGYSILEIPFRISLGTLLCFIGVLVIVAGLMAGLMISVFAFDAVRLKAIARNTSSKDCYRARRVLLLQDPHWILVTLVVVDALASETLPLLLNAILNPVAAVCTSVFLILIFGEILPQALFRHHALAFASALTYFILALKFLTAPISWPVGKVLDFCIGNRGAIAFNRWQLKEVIRYQEVLAHDTVNRDRGDLASQGPTPEQVDGRRQLHQLESQIMLGVLSLSESVGLSVLKKGIGENFTVHCDAIISKKMIQSMAALNLEYVPVYDEPSKPSNVTRVFELRLLLCLAYCDENDIRPMLRICDLPLLPLSRYSGDIPCNVLLDKLRSSPLRVAALTSPSAPSKVLGIVTMEDIVKLVHQTSFNAAYLGFPPSSSLKGNREAIVQCFRERNGTLGAEEQRFLQ